MKKPNSVLLPTAEQILLGTLLNGAAKSQANEAVDVLLAAAPDGFLDPRHGEIAAAIHHLCVSSTAVTTAAVCRRLGDTRRLQDAGGPGYVCGLLNYAVPSTQLSDCVSRLISDHDPELPSTSTPPAAPVAADSASPLDDQSWPEFPDNTLPDNPLHARTGKIARLPAGLRDQLNSRLLDGEPVDELLAWLNALPETQAVLSRLFGGHPVNKQNVSEWRRGGFQDWLVQQQAAHVFNRLSEDAAAIGPIAVVNFAEQLAIGLASRLAIMIDRFDPRTGDLEAQSRLAHQLFRDLATLRNAAYKRERLALQKESLALRRAESERRAEREKIKDLRLQRAEQERIARRSSPAARSTDRNRAKAGQATGAPAPHVHFAPPESVEIPVQSSQVKPRPDSVPCPLATIPPAGIERDELNQVA